jgi:hypothetical protein
MRPINAPTQARASSTRQLKTIGLLFLIAYSMALFVAFPSKHLTLYGDIFLKMANDPLRELQLEQPKQQILEALRTVDPSQDPVPLMKTNARLRIGYPLLLDLCHIRSPTSLLIFSLILTSGFIFILSVTAAMLFPSFQAQVLALASVTTSVPFFWHLNQGIGYSDFLSYTVLTVVFLALFFFRERHPASYIFSVSFLGFYLFVIHEANAFALATLLPAYCLFSSSWLQKRDFLAFGGAAILSGCYIFWFWPAWTVHCAALEGSSPVSFLIRFPWLALLAICSSFGINWIFPMYQGWNLFKQKKYPLFFLLSLSFIAICSQFLLAVDASRLMASYFLVIFVSAGLFGNTVSKKIFFVLILVALLTPKYIVGTNCVMQPVKSTPEKILYLWNK